MLYIIQRVEIGKVRTAAPSGPLALIVCCFLGRDANSSAGSGMCDVDVYRCARIWMLPK